MTLIHTVCDLEDADFKREFIILKGYDQLISLEGFTLMAHQNKVGVFANNEYISKQQWNISTSLIHVKLANSEEYLISLHEEFECIVTKIKSGYYKYACTVQ